jgi:hypothetical protein
MAMAAAPPIATSPRFIGNPDVAEIGTAPAKPRVLLRSGSAQISGPSVRLISTATSQPIAGLLSGWGEPACGDFRAGGMCFFSQASVSTINSVMLRLGLGHALSGGQAKHPAQLDADRQMPPQSEGVCPLPKTDILPPGCRRRLGSRLGAVPRLVSGRQLAIRIACLDGRRAMRLRCFGDGNER